MGDWKPQVLEHHRIDCMTVYWDYLTRCIIHKTSSGIAVTPITQIPFEARVRLNNEYNLDLTKWELKVT